jgi:hypothetical protein
MLWIQAGKSLRQLSVYLKTRGKHVGVSKRRTVFSRHTLEFWVSRWVRRAHLEFQGNLPVTLWTCCGLGWAELGWLSPPWSGVPEEPACFGTYLH